MMPIALLAIIGAALNLSGGLAADLVLDEDSYEATEDGIRIDKCVCDDFVQDALVTIEFSEVFDENFGCNLCHDYTMVSEDEDWIYCKLED